LPCSLWAKVSKIDFSKYNSELQMAAFHYPNSSSEFSPNSSVKGESLPSLVKEVWVAREPKESGREWNPWGLTENQS
jgi:hypothetical protein